MCDYKVQKNARSTQLQAKIDEKLFCYELQPNQVNLIVLSPDYVENRGNEVVEHRGKWTSIDQSLSSLY